MQALSERALPVEGLSGYADAFIKRIREQAEKLPKELTELFERCYRNTLDTTIRRMEDGTTHVITGDIPAMWLRDSTAQLRPYLFLAKENEEVRELIAGLVRRQFGYLCIEPYANAFNMEANGACWEKDFEDQNPWVWEKKYEIDSLCYPLQLAYLLWKNTGCTSQFDENFREGAAKILEVFRTEQHHETASTYRFQRKNAGFRDTLSRDGRGTPVKPGIGLIWSGFRPSDDACTWGYLIPANMFASVALGYLAEIAEAVLKDEGLARDARHMQEEIGAAIEREGRTFTQEFGEVYAYEVDGYGMFALMDDANVPSLLAMEYLGYPGDESVRENTRRLLLCEANPYYYKGAKAAGIGSAHTPSGYIWHIGMAMEGLTAHSREQKRKVLEQLCATTGGTGMMHEGFDCEDDSRYTREWFSWANAMYAELFLNYLGYELIK